MLQHQVHRSLLPHGTEEGTEEKMSETSYYIIAAVMAAVIILMARYTAMKKFGPEDERAEIRISIVTDENINREIKENWEARAVLKNGITTALDEIQKMSERREN